MSSHLLLQGGVSDGVDHDVPEVAANKDLTLCVLRLSGSVATAVFQVLKCLLFIELQAKHFVSCVFITWLFLNLPVFDHVSQLRENRGCLSVGATSRLF